MNKKEIMSKLEEQRKDLLASNTDFENANEAYSWAESIVFSENDVLEKYLDNQNLTIDDIDTNEFRDYQHSTVELFLQKKGWELSDLS